jgi:lipopolysaccharide transport system permease protein
VQALSERWRPILELNPLTLPIEQLRRVLLEGQWPAWQVLFWYTALSAIIAWLGARWFAATRKGFADVL